MKKGNKPWMWLFSGAVMVIVLGACTPSTAATPTQMPSPSPIPPTATKQVVMLPTWTPSPTETPRPTPTRQPTSTSIVTETGISNASLALASSGELVDRPSYATLAKPARLVSMQYDPATWALSTSYPAAYMGYALAHRQIYECRLEPVVVEEAEGYQVEDYTRPLGTTTYEIARSSQAGVLAFADYCSGEGEERTCYRVTPGDDHEGCIQASEEVLATFAIIPNPFFDPLALAPNHWLCQDEAGVAGRCMVSYSVPLNALTYTNNGEGWAGGDDGLLLHLANQAWSEANSPTTYPIYGLSFSSPTNGWAVGKGAQVLRWDGSQWAEILPYHAQGEGPGGSTQILYAVDVKSEDNAWMVGYIKDISGKNSPYALHWDGTDLVEQSAFPDCGCGLNAVLILGENDVIAVGGSILGALALRWDGSTWTSTSIPGADALYTLRRAPDGAVWAGGIEYARDQSDTRGALFRFDGGTWVRVALPPLTGGIYQLAFLGTGEYVLGGDFSALWSGSEWQPVMAGLAGYGWIVDIETDAQGKVWALTRSGNLFLLQVGE